MTFEMENRSKGSSASFASTSEPGEPSAEQLRLLGDALHARAPEVLRETVEQTRDSGEQVTGKVQESFERICSNSTVAVARWIAGDGLEVTLDASRETSHIFGELAAHRAASLHEVTRRSFWWRNVMADVLRDCAGALNRRREALAHALTMLQLSLEFSLLRVCECFERRAQADRRGAHAPRGGARVPGDARPADRTPQPDADPRSRRADAGALRHAARRRSRRCSSTSTTSRASTTRSATASATNCCRLSRRGSRRRARGRRARPPRRRRVRRDRRGAVADGRPRAGRRTPARGAQAAVQARRSDEETTLTVSASIGIAVGRARHRRRAAARCRHRDVPRQVGRTQPLRRVRDRHAETPSRTAWSSRWTCVRRSSAASSCSPTSRRSTCSRHAARPGVEALIRWRNPERGLVQPDAFIPLLEETGLIIEVGRWVLREACRRRPSGGEPGIAIEHGRQRFRAPARQQIELIADIEAALAESGLAPAALTIEITETTLMRNIEETARRLTAIKELGVRIAIDDFGTGYSSLAYLQQVPRRCAEDRPLVHRRADEQQGGRDADPHARAARQGALDRDLRRGHRGAAGAVAAARGGLRQRAGVPVRRPLEAAERRRSCRAGARARPWRSRRPRAATCPRSSERSAAAVPRPTACQRARAGARRRYARTFVRLPHTAMSHQTPERLRERS